MSATAVPIVAYHSIANPHRHLYAPLSLPLAIFERQLQYLHRHRFVTVSLADVHAFLRDGATLPDRAVALTFDDGYLDNWVYAFPLLKKYRMKATVFIVTDLVDPRNVVRPTLDDSPADAIGEAESNWWGYLSWRELEAMRASGLVDVQAHTCTHTWHFSGERVVDFHHPDDAYHWLDWNAHPEEKPSWLTRDFRAGVPWGRPVYEFSQTLLKPRYFEDPELSRRTTAHVAAYGGRAFFARAGWREELQQLVQAYRAAAGALGRYESEAEYEARAKDEMMRCRRIISERLGTPVDFLCWPCGDYTPRLQKWAVEDCGYLASVNVQKVGNHRGDDPRELRRIGFGQDYLGPRRSDLLLMNFVGSLNYHRGVRAAFPVAPVARRLMRVGRLLDRVRGRGGARP